MNWKVFIIVFLLPALVLAQQPPVPSPDREYPPVETIPPGDDRIVPLKKGEEAPYDGQFFSIDTAIRWGNWLQQYRYRLVWDVELEQKICQEETSYKDSLLTIEKERAQKVEISLREALRNSEKERLGAEEAVRNPPWYSTTEFGIVIGVISTAAAFALAVWAVDAGTGE